MTHGERRCRTVGICLLLALGLGCGGGEEQASPRLRVAGESEVLDYELLATVEYRGVSTFTSQVSGVLSVQKTPLPSGEVAYGYAFSSEAGSPGLDANAEVRSPAVPLLREPKSERFVGGAPLLRNFSRVANACLDQMGASVVPDGAPVVRECHFPGGGILPARIRYRLRASRQSLVGENDAVAVLAVSDPISFPQPGEFAPIQAEHRVLCVMDAAMDRVHLQVSCFVAEPTGGASGQLRAEIAMRRLSGIQPVDLSGLDGRFEEYVAALHLAPEADTSGASNRGLPGWAMTALAVRDAADVSAGAAIEGRPNFAITATIGAALLVDSGVSAVTTLLNEAGVIQWRWKGIPNWIGEKAGLGAAKGFERITAKDVDEETWKEVGGVVGDAASLFLPGKVLDSGVTVSSAGVRIIQGQSIAGKTIRISKHGIDLVRKGRNWRHAEKVGRELLDLKMVVDGTLTALEAAEVLEGLGEREAGDSDPDPREPGRSGFSGYSEETISRFRTLLKSADWSEASPERNPQGMLEAVHERTGLTFVLIPPGEFRITLTRGGTPHAETARCEIREPFLISKTECTQQAFARGGGKGRSRFRGADRPVEMVSWEDCRAWCARNGLRMPREDEWEYACRAGNTTMWCFGDDGSLLPRYAFFNDNSGGRTHPVAQKEPNHWGLFDVHGNISELCDDFRERYLGDVSPTDAMRDSGRVARGGCWGSLAVACRSFFRMDGLEPGGRNQFIGFRPAATLP